MLKKIKTKIKKNRQKKQAHYSAYNKPIMAWVAPEFLQYHKGAIWKISALIIISTIIVLGIIFNAWTFSLLVLTLSVVYYLAYRENPKMVNVIISDVGVKVGERHYPFSRIKGFWLVYHAPYVKKLNIRVKDSLLVDIPILLHQQEPGEVRKVLLEKVPEIEGVTEPLSESLLRLLKI